MFSVGNKQRDGFAQVVLLGYSSKLCSCVLNEGDGSYDINMGDFLQPSGVAQIRVLQGVLYQPIMTRLIILHFLQYCNDNTNLLIKNWEKLQSDEQSSTIIGIVASRYTSWPIQSI